MGVKQSAEVQRNAGKPADLTKHIPTTTPS